jgi:hypothetical protein
MTFGGDYIGLYAFSLFCSPSTLQSFVRGMYHIQLQYIANLCTSTIDGQKHNSTMVSDASPATTAPKMNKPFVHMAHVFSNRACTQDEYLKCPHPTIIDGHMRWDSGWILGGFGVGGHRTRK